jgi:hypothetical protein
MNSLQIFYAQTKMKKQSNKQTKADVIVRTRTMLPQSTILKDTILEKYRTNHTDSNGVRRRPLVPLFIG